jgi:hypothetical protein
MRRAPSQFICRRERCSGTSTPPCFSQTRCCRTASGRRSNAFVASRPCVRCRRRLARSARSDHQFPCVLVASQVFFLGAEAAIAAFGGRVGSFSALHNRQGDWQRVSVGDWANPASPDVRRCVFPAVLHQPLAPRRACWGGTHWLAGCSGGAGPARLRHGHCARRASSKPTGRF